MTRKIKTLILFLVTILNSCSPFRENENESQISTDDMSALNNESIGLSFSYEISSESKKLKIRYLQKKYQFCLYKRSLVVIKNSKLQPEYGWFQNTNFSIDTEYTKLSEYLDANYKIDFDDKEKQFLKLENGSGQFYVDISDSVAEQFDNSYKYVSIQLFPCSQIFSDSHDPIVRAINFSIRIEPQLR